jgi:hypothetical protein
VSAPYGVISSQPNGSATARPIHGAFSITVFGSSGQVLASSSARA